MLKASELKNQQVVRCSDLENTCFDMPEGTEIITMFENNVYFWKDNGRSTYYDNGWKSCKSNGINDLDTHLQIYPGTQIVYDNITDKIETKLHYIEQWLKGYKLQYQLGKDLNQKQWHNFTENAMQYIKRSDIRFRISPKFITIDGRLFKDIRSLVSYALNNYDLHDNRGE